MLVPAREGKMKPVRAAGFTAASCSPPNLMAGLAQERAKRPFLLAPRPRAATAGGAAAPLPAAAMAPAPHAPAAEKLGLPLRPVTAFLIANLGAKAAKTAFFMPRLQPPAHGRRRRKGGRFRQAARAVAFAAAAGPVSASGARRAAGGQPAWYRRVARPHLRPPTCAGAGAVLPQTAGPAARRDGHGGHPAAAFNGQSGPAAALRQPTLGRRLRLGPG